MRTLTIVERDDGTLEVLRDERSIPGQSFVNHNEYYLTNYVVKLERTIKPDDVLPTDSDPNAIASRVIAGLEFISSCGPQLSNCGVE